MVFALGDAVGSASLAAVKLTTGHQARPHVVPPRRLRETAVATEYEIDCVAMVTNVDNTIY